LISAFWKTLRHGRDALADLPEPRLHALQQAGLPVHPGHGNDLNQKLVQASGGPVLLMHPWHKENGQIPLANSPTPA